MVGLCVVWGLWFGMGWMLGLAVLGVVYSEGLARWSEREDHLRKVWGGMARIPGAGGKVVAPATGRVIKGDKTGGRGALADMKTTLMVLGLGMGMAAAGWGEPVKPEPVDPLAAELAEEPRKPDRRLSVVPADRAMRLPELEALLDGPAEDPMLKSLMAEMLKEAEEDRKEMEAPVEFPKLDAPELQHLLETMGVPRNAPDTKRWALGAHLRSDPGDRIVVAVVTPGSPAEEAGLQAGDLLEELNGIRLRDHAMLGELLQVIRDQEVELGVLRGEDHLQVKITARQMDLPEGHARRTALRTPPGSPASAPGNNGRDDEILEELRGMRALDGGNGAGPEEPAPRPGTRVRRCRLRRRIEESRLDRARTALNVPT